MDLEMSSTSSGGQAEVCPSRMKDVMDEEEETVPVEVDYGDNEDDATTRFSLRRLLIFAGPGLLMSIAYVDPGNLESDLQTGAVAGYTLGWLIMWSTALGFIVQLLAVRLGVVTGKDLAQSCRDVYPTGPRIVLWLMTEIAIIGSDIQEVIGSAIAIQLLSQNAIPLWAGVLITGLDTFFLLYLERLGVRKLEAFFGLLVGIMTISFGIMYFQADVPGDEVLKGVVLPRVSSSQLSVATGIVGSLVMPHNIFLHSALVQSRKIDITHTGAKREALLYNAIESAFSLSITVFINICVMAVFATGFHSRPEKERDTVGLSTAGNYLKEEYGSAMMYVWALGLLAAGQSSTMTGTYTGQFVMGGFLDMHVSPFVRAAVTRGFALVPTLIVAFAYAGTNQMDTLNQDLNVLQSLQLPFALLPVLYVTSREDIMGEKFMVKSAFKAVVYVICALLLAINLSVVLTTGLQFLEYGLVAALFTLLFGISYAAFVVYLFVGPRAMHAVLSRLPFAGAKCLADALGRDGGKLGDAGGGCSGHVDVLPLVSRDIAPGSLASLTSPDSVDLPRC